ncbi:uncharacterized protein [Dermacentor albipictus]|uniref:uncharacterized protein n=1 Tax=Dermacentor albipictus TaxID=60249 RepID=UPI0038FD3023
MVRGRKSVQMLTHGLLVMVVFEMTYSFGGRRCAQNEVAVCGSKGNFKERWCNSDDCGSSYAHTAQLPALGHSARRLLPHSLECPLLASVAGIRPLMSGLNEVLLSPNPRVKL